MLFTWTSPEHSQVMLVHIPLRYSCHQALASGEEMFRDRKRGMRGSEGDNAEKQNDKKMCESVCTLIFFLILFS